MRRSLTMITLTAVFSLLAFAESWQGKIVDTTCFEQHKSATTCDPSSSTTMFALVVSDKAYKLDEAGNAKVAEAIKSRADRASDPAKAPNTAVMAKITGTKGDNDTLKVDTVEVQ